MSIDDEWSDEQPALDPATARLRSPVVAWPVIAVLLAFMACAVLIGAGWSLSEAGVGGSVVRRGCRPDLAGGLLLLMLAGGLAGTARVVVDLRSVYMVSFDWTRCLVLSPVPLLMLGLTAPGFLGCRGAARLAERGFLGDALLGAPGIAVTGAVAVLAGMVIPLSIRVQPPRGVVVAAPTVERY